MADYNRPPPPHTDHHLFEFGSSLPPGALLPSIPGYSAPTDVQSSPRMSATRHGGSRDNMHGDFAYNPGAPPPTLHSRSGAERNGVYSMREMHAAMPPVPPAPPPRPHEGGPRRALPKIPGHADESFQAPRPAPPPPAPAPAPAPPSLGPSNAPPMPPPRPGTTRRALPTPPTAPPPVPKPPVSSQSALPTYESPSRTLPHPVASQSQRGTTLPYSSSHYQQPPQASPEPPVRQVSNASSTYGSRVSHTTTDSYFGTPSTVPTSVTSHSAQSPNYAYNSNYHTSDMSTIRSESPTDDGLAYRSRLDIPGQRIRKMSENEELLSSTPTAPSWAHEHAQSRLAASPSVNSLQTEAAQTPPLFVQTPSPVPTPAAPAPVAFPDARPSEAEAMLNFPSAHPSMHGPSSHQPQTPRQDLYDVLGVGEPEWMDGQDDDSPAHHAQPIASSSNAHRPPNGTSGAVMDGRSGEPDSAHRHPARWYQNKLALHQANGGDELYDEDGYEYASSGEEDEAEDEMNEYRFFNPAYLSETAVQVRDRVIRGAHVKGGITYGGSFTGTDLVHTIGNLLPPFTRDGPADRRFALQTAKSLHSQLWVVEADWVPRPMRDSPDDVFKFMSDMDGMGEDVSLPKGVLTMATKCYSSSCNGNGGCYSPRCPYTTPPNSFLTVVDEEPGPSRQPVAMVKNETDWTEDVPAAQLAVMTDAERGRQTLIRQAILLEERYEADLAIVEQSFIIPLQTANPPIVQPYGKLDQYVRQLFSNIVEIRHSSRALLDNFAIHLREQGPLVQNVGDIFLEAAIEFRSLYPTYTDSLPKAETLLNKLLEEHRPFAHWMMEVSSGAPERRLDLRYLLKRPAMHLQAYPQLIQQILDKTPPESPDCDFLNEALESIQNISYLSRLKLFQASKGRGPHGKLRWDEIVSPNVLKSMTPNACRLQHNIWELIEGEMQYVADLEAIDTVFITPLREADRPIIDRSRLEVFIDDAFHNYRSILDVHERLLADFHERQLEQHPNFGMVSDLMLNAVLHWHEAYMEYMPHYPIAKAKIDEEKSRNPAFAAFLAEALTNPAANKLDIPHYIYRPIARLVRYKMLLESIAKTKTAVLLEQGQVPEEDSDIAGIPQVIDLTESLAKAGNKGVAVNEAKVALWALKTTLDGGKLGPRVVRDLDLLNPMRELIHQGKVFRQPEGTIGGSWTELHLLLFDNYFVQVKHVTKSKNKETTRYSINRRPIPLELLTLGDFLQPAQTRSIGVLNKIGGKGHGDGKEQTQSDSRTVHPFTFSIIGAGLSSGQYTLWTDSESARCEWHEKLLHAKVLRTEVDEANRVFEFTPLSLDTFYMAPGYGVHPHAQQEYTGRVTCSVPFVTVDNRKLVAVGCEQGVWIGVQHDPPSLRKVLHVKSVTQIAVLEEFGIFLVLADKSLLAYHLEALVPTAASPQARAAPQRLGGMRDLVFFVVGQISGRTLVLYVKRKGIDSVFRVLEPVLSSGPEAPNPRRGPLGNFLNSNRPEWFRVYKDFFIPTEALHVHFLKAKIAIVCAKGFEIMGLDDLRGGSIPIFDPNKTRDRPPLGELARRCENAKPIAMFRSTDSEFLLCYDRFGIYVDRHGEPNRDMQPIEWEGTPENIVFHPPYLLLISPSFIEVRHIDTAKLLQIYTGVDIRCTWDGTGGMVKRHNDAPGPKGWGPEVTSTDPRIHICKRTDDPRRTKGIGQHVYELTPTLLLNNPLLNPVHTQDPNYFPPAPLNHRTSMSNSSYAGGGYLGDPYANAMDRQSVSSASTTTFPNPNGFTSQTQLMGGMQQPGMLHPLGRRVSDMSTPSIPSAPGGSGFEMPTVYQNEVRDDYDYINRGPSREYDRGMYQQAGMPQPQPQRHSSNEWSSPSLTTGSADPFDNYGPGGYQPQAHAQPQYGHQQQVHGYQQHQSQRGPNEYAHARMGQAQPQRGPNDYAPANQAGEFGGYESQQQFAADYQGYLQSQQQAYQGGGQGYYR